MQVFLSNEKIFENKNFFSVKSLPEIDSNIFSWEIFSPLKSCRNSWQKSGGKNYQQKFFSFFNLLKNFRRNLKKISWIVSCELSCELVAKKIVQYCRNLFLEYWRNIFLRTSRNLVLKYWNNIVMVVTKMKGANRSSSQGS